VDEAKPKVLPTSVFDKRTAGLPHNFC